MSHAARRYPVPTVLCVKVVIAFIMAVGLQESFSGCATAAVMPIRGKGGRTHGAASPGRGPRISEHHQARVKQMTDNYELVQVDMSELLVSLKENRKRSKREADNNGEATASSKTTASRSSRSSKTEQHPPEISFLVNVGGKELRLDLGLNRNLIAPHFQLHSLEESGRRLIEHGATNCYYHGNVLGLPGETYAVISTCSGLSGIFGQKGTNNGANKFSIEPLADEAEMNGSHWHAVFNEPEPSDISPQFNVRHSCGLDNFTTNGIDGDKNNVTVHTDRYSPGPDEEESHEQRVKRQATPLKSKIVELVFVADNLTYHKLQKNASEVARFLMVEANKVDEAYRELDVSIVVVGIIVFTKNTPFSLQHDNFLLERFTTYTMDSVTNFFNLDHAHFVTGRENSRFNPLIGLAWGGGICKEKYQTAYSNYFAKGLHLIITHELGHNFGLEHLVDLTTCNNTCSDTKPCIMSATSNLQKQHEWSNCSKMMFPSLLQRHRCLNNIPGSIKRKPFCGDGIVEGNEHCDCGPTKVCKDTCCNATTCALRTDAQCSSSSDVCCDRQTCTRLGNTAVCRNSTGACDMAGNCTGTSSTECPINFAPPGTQCTNQHGAGFCHLGVCSNRSSQCPASNGLGCSGHGVCTLQNLCQCQDDWSGENCQTAKTSQPICGDGIVEGNEHCDCGPTKVCKDTCCDATTCALRTDAQCSSSSDVCCDRQTCTRLGNTAVCRNSTGACDMAGNCTGTSSTECPINFAPTGTQCTNQHGAGFCHLGVCSNKSSQCPASNGLGCSGHGVCTPQNLCQCQDGWSGENCQTAKTAAGGLSAGGTAGLTISLLMLVAATGVLLYVKRAKISDVLAAHQHVWPSWRLAQSGEHRAQTEGLATEDSSVSPSLSPNPTNNKKINHYAVRPNDPPQRQGGQLQVQSDQFLAPQVQKQPQDKGPKHDRPPPPKAASWGPPQPPPSHSCVYSLDV